METNKKNKFTKYEKTILSTRDFSGDDYELKNPYATIRKNGYMSYSGDFKYPAGYYYEGITQPTMDFGKLLEMISKFDRYHKDPNFLNEPFKCY
jgi:hypothetical protein